MRTFWKVLGTLAVSILSLPAWSQHESSKGAEEVAGERLRIESQRQHAMVELEAAEQACKTRFMVNSCVYDVGVRRIAILSEFRRQEASLNDAARHKRAAEQIKLGDEKQAERALSDADLTRSPAPSQAERKMAQDAKILEHRKAAVPSNGASNDGRTPVTPAVPDVQTNRSAHLQRLEDARQRRVERDKHLLDRPSGVAPLPAPP